MSLGDPLSNVNLFLSEWGLTLPAKEEWRVVREQVYGEINGLPGTYGKLVLTNGMLCYIIRPSDQPFLGHLDFFTPNKPEHLEVVRNLQASLSKTKVIKTPSDFERLVDSLMS